jgi:hypothetical protein
MSDHEYLTITMTGRRPVWIKLDNWPILTSGQGKTTGREYRITVRQHADGRTIVYGVYNTRWQGERDIRAGVILAAGDDIIAAIDEVAGTIGAGTPCVQECIQGLPAENLDPEITMDESCVCEQANDDENDEIEIVIDPVLAERMAQEERAFEEMLAVEAVKNKVFMCSVCHVVEVFPADGEDTCPECVKKI